MSDSFTCTASQQDRRRPGNCLSPCIQTTFAARRHQRCASCLSTACCPACSGCPRHHCTNQCWPPCCCAVLCWPAEVGNGSTHLLVNHCLLLGLLIDAYPASELPAPSARCAAALLACRRHRLRCMLPPGAPTPTSCWSSWHQALTWHAATRWARFYSLSVDVFLCYVARL